MLGFGALSLVLMGAFLALEARIENPIMPLRILRLRGLIGSSVVRGLLVTGMYSTFFLGTLYLEHVLPLQRAATPGWRSCPGRVTVGDPLARHHRAAGRVASARCACSSPAWGR